MRLPLSDNTHSLTDRANFGVGCGPPKPLLAVISEG